MAETPFDPTLTSRFVLACQTSLERISSPADARNWLALRHGIDADGLKVYADYYAGEVIANIEAAGADVSDAERIAGAFVGGFLVALEMTSSRGAANS